MAENVNVNLVPPIWLDHGDREALYPIRSQINSVVRISPPTETGGVVRGPRWFDENQVQL
jgi:hypothetical protein